jgi:DNA-binding transcriptional MerR regulator
MQTFTIREVAQHTNLSAHTLRYYERIGLLSTGRGANGHRRFTAEDLEWIRVLTCLRETGMSIRRMLDYADLAKRGDSTVAERRALLEAHRADVRAQIARYQRDLAMIEAKIRRYSEE